MVSSPLSNYWNSFLQKGCMEEEYRLLPGIYSNAVMDVMILVTPCPALWKLHLPVRDRIVLIGMMCLGFMYGSQISDPLLLFLLVYD